MGNVGKDAIALCRKGNSHDMSVEKRLIRDLMTNYARVGKNGRPVRDIATAVPVKFGLGLTQLDLDEKHKILALSTWTRYVWIDEYLRWNRTQYGGLARIRLDPELLWVPDIMLQNTPLVTGTIKDADVDIANRHAMAVVDFRGKVAWYPHAIFRSSCYIDITNFPFDHQKCPLYFGSWTYSVRELNLTMHFQGGIDLSSFQEEFKESCPWDITNLTSERQPLQAPNNEPPFIVLTFEISMRRKMVFSSYILTLPCIFLACLTLVVFCLAAERPDRTSLAMSIFSSFMVLLLILVEAAPPTASSIPTLGIYYCFNMVIIMLSVILSSLVINVSRGFNTGEMPSKVLQAIIGKYLAAVMLARDRDPGGSEFNKTLQKLKKNTESQPRKLLVNHSAYSTNVTRNSLLRSSNSYHDEDMEGQIQHLEIRMRELRESVECMESRFDESTIIRAEHNQVMMQWKYLALVLDRFFFTLYMFLIVGSLCTLFPRPA